MISSTKKRSFSSTHLRSKKRKKSKNQLSNVKLQRYYFTYYRGWCENSKCVLFPTVNAAMVWQLLHVVKDGFTQIFQDQLPSTFSFIGVLEVDKKTINYIEENMISNVIGISQLFPDIIPTYSASLERFLQNVPIKIVTDKRFFNLILRQYLLQMKEQPFVHIQRLFCPPDFYRSSQSITGNKTVYNRLLNHNYDCYNRPQQNAYCPHTFDTNGLRICNSYSIKESLCNVKELNSNSRNILNHNTYEQFTTQQIRTLQSIKCNRIIISIGAGTASTEIRSMHNYDYIICLDNCKRDVCTAIISNRIFNKDKKGKKQRIIFRLFDLRHHLLLYKFSAELFSKIAIRPIILFQHPTPNSTFVEEVLSPSIEMLMHSIVRQYIHEVIFVYDSSKSNSKNLSNFFTKEKLEHMILSYKELSESILCSAELSLSCRGQRLTLHPLFELNTRSGWANMKHQDEYCITLKRR